MPVAQVVSVIEHTAGSELVEAPAVGALLPSTTLYPSETLELDDGVLFPSDFVYPSTNLYPGGASVLEVVDVNEFDLDGGQLTIGGEIHNYSIAPESVDPDGSGILTLTDDVTGSYGAGEPVMLYPATVERWADVLEPDGEETLRCRVPHNLFDRLAQGVREQDEGEIVTFGEDDTDLVVADVLGKEPVVDGTFLDDETVLGPAISSEAIVARHILAGEITADKLAAILLLVSQIKTAEDGQRIEIDGDGIKWYDGSGNLGIFFPTASGQAAVLNADLVAASLDVTGAATFRATTNAMEVGSVMALQSSQSDPGVAPSVSVTYEQLDLTGGDETQVAGTGIFYTATGASGGATPAFYCSQDVQTSPASNSLIEEYNASTGALIRQIVDGGDGTGLRFYGAVQATVSGTKKIIALCRVKGFSATIATSSDIASLPHAGWYLIRINASDLDIESAKDVTSAIPNTPDGESAQLGLVGGNPTIVTFNPTAYVTRTPGVARLLTYNASTLTLSSTQDLSGRNYTPTDNEVRFTALVDDGTSLWVGVRKDPTYGNVNHRYNASTFAYESNHDFTSADIYGSRGLTWDGTRFWSRSAGAPRLLKHTNWDWTTESPKYWFGYTWYDGTHETLVSPRAQKDLAALRRTRLAITVPTFPSGISHARLYVARNATAPATTALKLQAATTYIDADTGVSRYEIDFNDSGAAPPTSNGFGAGTAAEIKSQIAGTTPWRLKGDGTFKPPAFTTTQRDAISSPPAGYLIVNVSTNKLNYYDGSGWIEVDDAGIELGYAAITADATRASTTPADVSGLSTTVTVGTRPIVVALDCNSVFNNAANGGVRLDILEDGSVIARASSLLNTASTGTGIHREVRRAPSAGSHTYKAQLATLTAGTATIKADSATLGPAFITVREV